MDVSIRPATVEDAERIADIYVTSVSTLCTKNYSKEHIKIITDLFDAESYRDAIKGWDINIFVAVAEEIVGFGSIMIDDWRIGDLFVLPDFTRQGVATRLIDAVENYALQSQICQLSVTSSLTAQPFYLACGYEYAGDSVIAEKINTVEMTKSLSQSTNPKTSRKLPKSNAITLTGCVKSAS